MHVCNAVNIIPQVLVGNSQKFRQNSPCNLQSRVIRNCRSSVKKKCRFPCKARFRKISETRHRNNMNWKDSSGKISERIFPHSLPNSIVYRSNKQVFNLFCTQQICNTRVCIEPCEEKHSSTTSLSSCAFIVHIGHVVIEQTDNALVLELLVTLRFNGKIVSISKLFSFVNVTASYVIRRFLLWFWCH